MSAAEFQFQREADGVRSLLVIGDMKLQDGDLHGALASYQDAQAFLQAADSSHPAESIATAMAIGGVRYLQGDLDGAADAYAEGLRICECSQTLDSAEAVAILTALGTVRQQQQRPDAAAWAWTEARRIRAVVGTLESPDGAVLLTNLGVVRRASGDLEGALAAYEEARHLHLAAMTHVLTSFPSAPAETRDMDPQLLASQWQPYASSRPGTAWLANPPGAVCLHSAAMLAGMGLGGTSRPGTPGGPKLHELEAMVAAYGEEQRMMQATQTLETASGAELMMELATLRSQQGDFEGAAVAFEEAKRLDWATKTVAPTDCADFLGTSCPLSPVSTKHLAAGSPLQAARQARHVDAMLGRMRAA